MATRKVLAEVSALVPSARIAELDVARDTDEAERAGIRVDRDMLSRLSGDFSQILARLEEEIQEDAQETFSVSSPKQIGDILFGKMGLSGGTKTKTGAWSTTAQVLDDLAEQGHALPSKILEWRQVSKLKSTYTDALPTYVNPQTHRVHTTYALAATTTGRLSSNEPNLQNIPVRTEDGRKIRRAFIATPGHKLVSADYSQIELRLLAEIADVPVLRQAFRDGLDIHAMTASEMFGVPIEGFRHPAPDILESWNDRLTRLIATLRKGDVLVVANIRALGRDADEGARTVAELRRHGIIVKVLSHNARHLADAAAVR